MTRPVPPAFETATIDDLAIDDERSFRHVALYADLKEVLRRARYAFRVLSPGTSSRDAPRWDRALFLNLTFWGAGDGGDVLMERRVPADVVAHVAWHHLAARALEAGPCAKLSADALFLGEAIASAFDVYLVGRLLGHAPRSTFLETQVPAMAEAADAAGLDEDGFERLLEEIAEDPDRAFEDLRALLFDAATSLVACRGAGDALAALDRLEDRRFAPLLHRHELSNWILYARAYAGDALAPDPRVRDVDRALRDQGAAGAALEWLDATWVAPAVDRRAP